MSEKRWTDEQGQAISAPTANLLIAAAAGAGKTAVLVERIIRKIMDEKNPKDIDKMLVVTFTNAAASEMRERIASAIEKMLDVDKSSKTLQRQLTLLNKSSIITIHSFCLEVIRNNFHSIDLDPTFRISDTTEATLLKLEALEDMFEEKYEDEINRKDFIDLVECYGGSKDDKALQDIVLNVFEYVQSDPWPDQWLLKMSERFRVDDDFKIDETIWIPVLKKHLKAQIQGALIMLQKAATIIEKTSELMPYLPTFQDNILEVKGLLKGCDGTWESLYHAFSTLSFGRLSGKVKEADEELKEKVKGMRDSAKKELDKIKKNIFWADPEDIKKSLSELYPMMSCLSALVIEFSQRYMVKKREKGLLDFSDLEHLCLKILTDNPDIANGYKDRFEDIFVDEYQDSNDVQEVLLSKISREDRGTPNIFMVGDVKQSIYRFRQAKPELFLNKYKSYSGDTLSQYRKIKLFKNFRSRDNVINGVNYIFKQIMSVDMGELDYDEDEALNPGADYPCYEDNLETHGDIELHLMDYGTMEDGNNSDADEEDEDSESTGSDLTGVEEETPDIMQAEARIIGKRILELVKPGNGTPFKVYDGNKKEYRPASYKDIVILLRATKTWSDVFVEELSRMDIPAYADSGAGYFRTTEIQTIMSLLNIIDNPMQDIPLLAVMRSPIGYFSTEELADIRMFDREDSFYGALKKLIIDETAKDMELKGKAVLFLQKLESWREKARYTPTDELIWLLYNATGYFGYVGAMPGGLQRQANLRILFQRARQYEETAYKGLFNFINFINKMQSSRGDLGSAKILGENEDVVRIMSIHKSKGLEFPIVIVAGTGKGFNLMDMNKSILLHQELGFGPDYVNHLERIQYPSIAKEAIRSKIKLESLSEEMRILYVAFTRAKEKLIITGSTKNLEKSVAKWNETANVEGKKLPAYEILKGKNYLDWICPALVRHRGCTRLTMVEDDYKEYYIEDASRWSISFYDRSHVGLDSNMTKEAQNVFEFLDAKALEALDAEKEKLVFDRLSWQYPYKEAATLPAKLSVTELKKHSRQFGEEFAENLLEIGDFNRKMFIPPLIKKPQFLQEEKSTLQKILSAVEKGNAMHLVLQHINMKDLEQEEAIAHQIDQLVEKEIMLEKEAEAVNVEVINEFFSSTLGNRMTSALKVHREAPFNVDIKCRELRPDLSSELYEDETIMLQGVIDCYFEEPDGLILLDYKTGFMQQEYNQQVNYYANVLEKVTGKKVKEKYIVMLPVDKKEKLKIIEIR